MVDTGNTVLVIEHNLDVIKCADWIIDLGPEGGDAGGELVAEGTPEQICADPASETGKVLRRVLPVRASPAVGDAPAGGGKKASRGKRATQQAETGAM